MTLQTFFDVHKDENSNEETQELCGSDNPISDHKLPNELSEVVNLCFILHNQCTHFYLFFRN